MQSLLPEGIRDQLLLSINTWNGKKKITKKKLACEIHLEEQCNSHQSRVMLLMSYWAQSSKLDKVTVS